MLGYLSKRHMVPDVQGKYLINDSHRACLADFGLPAILYKTKMVYTLPNTHPYLRTRNNAVDGARALL